MAELADCAGRRVVLGGAVVDLRRADEVVAEVAARLVEAGPPARTGPPAPLGIASANLDHVHHFGAGGASRGDLDALGDSPRWLVLLDGVPLVRRARAVTGADWPLLAGSDLLPDLLTAASGAGARVGFLGGTPGMHELLRARLGTRYPGLVVAGMWAPSRRELANPARAATLAAEVRDAGTDLLVVGLGKPRQERWIQRHGSASGARVLLAFGAAAEFLAGTVNRAPHWVRDMGLEWAYRLVREPRRLARRYLVQGPAALWRLRTASGGVVPARPPGEADRPGARTGGLDDVADCAVIVVAYRSAGDLPGLLDTLPAAAGGLRLRVVVVDNDSGDDIAGALAGRAGVTLVPAGGNLGYAGGINVGRRHTGPARAVAVLNPDLRLAPGALRLLVDAVTAPGGGAAVPRFVEESGATFRSLRREPSIGRALGDALLGARWPTRPGWLSELVWSPAAYRETSTVDWATGAVLVLSAEADALVGAWDDQRFFLYCEETDYSRRLRAAGLAIRYVPDAVVRHRGGGSGTAPELTALNTVNRVRYYRKHHGRLAGAAFRATVVVHELLRVHRAPNRLALRAVLSERRWAGLPGGRVTDGRTR